MSTRRLVWGVLFVVLGVLFLLDQLNAIDLRASYVFPIVVIAVGAAILAGALGMRDRNG
jgi:uncharacterized membrane protein HdeD (DUF308 family)